MSSMNAWLNGAQQDFDFRLQQAMFYPNAYINFDAYGNFTKHYYNGTERIVSRLGTENIVIANDDEDFEERRNHLRSHFNNDIQELLYAEENIDMSLSEIDTLYFQPTGSPGDDIFYYHTNHLGSTAFVTDNNSSITQGFVYAPFGEIISEYNATFGNDVIPKYSFNAKELDEETGMYYFEARYYRAPTFTSRDPLFEKYFWMSPYAYCFNNPVKFVDPTGMEGEITDLVLADQSRGTNHTQTLVNSLSKISGMDITTETRDGRTFLNYAKDANGNPIVKTDADGNSIGSETARGMLQNLIDNPDVVNVSRVKSALGSHCENGKNQINLDFEQILGLMNGVQGGLNPETLGYGMTFLHEFTHTPLGGNLSDDPHTPGYPGPAADKINKIRAELNKQGGNYGQRMDYLSTPIKGSYYLPFDITSLESIKKGNLPSSVSKYIKF